MKKREPHLKNEELSRSFFLWHSLIQRQWMSILVHPEEILADNFALLVLDEQNVPSPEILQRMRAALVQS
jgi:hypothetical protein